MFGRGIYSADSSTRACDESGMSPTNIDYMYVILNHSHFTVFHCNCISNFCLVDLESQTIKGQSLDMLDLSGKLLDFWGP